MRLLIADDEENLAYALKAVLEDAGYNCDVCFDGNSAIRLISQEIYDGLILDIMMPGIDGLTVCKELRKKNCLVIMATQSLSDAVSSGLLYSMSRDEAEAVLAHEVSHVANGDMVTLTLIQGVVNTFVMFFARIVAGVISNFFSSNNEEESSSTGGFAYMITVFVLEMVFGVLASIIVMWFSRQREFRADAGAAKLAGRDKMIAALQRLARGAEPQMEGSMMAFGINGKRSMSELFMSHPPIEQRIAALRG